MIIYTSATTAATDVTTYFKLVDPSTGVPETGLTITDLDATYVRDRAAAVKADLTALAAVDSAHGDNKAIQIDATNAPGLYRVDWPDAAFATGVSRVQLVVNGAAIDPAVIEVELMTPISEEDAFGDIDDAITTFIGDGSYSLETLGDAAEDIQGRIPAALTANGNMKSSLMEILTTALTETAGYLAAGFKKFFNVLTPVMTVESVNQTGDSYALVSTEVAEILADTNELQAEFVDGGRLDLLIDGIKTKTDYLPSVVAGAAGGVFIAGANAATSITTALTTNITGNLSGSVGSVTGAVGSVTGAVGSVTGAVGSVTGAVGSVTAGVTLADDAITSAKFDESTAYPVKSADTGATQIARVGADSDTLETLSDQIDGISAATIADTVWDELLAGHAVSGSAGEALSAAGGAADPLLNTVPGTYASGTAGAALGRIGSGQITTVSPVAQNGNVQTYMGQDYDNADGYALDWTDTSAQWPDLTSATVSVKVFTRSAGTLTFTGSVVTATGSSKKVRLELTDVQTLTIPSGSYRFLVLATQADSDIYVLVEGVWESKPTT